jgi:DNA-binding protein
MKEMQTVIIGATVFRDGARVTRTGKTELGKGEQIIKIGGITAYAHEDSIRVKGRGKAILRGIDVRKVTETYQPDVDIKKDLEKLRELEKEKKNIQDQIDLQQTRISHLSSIMTQFSSEFGKWLVLEKLAWTVSRRWTGLTKI